MKERTGWQGQSESQIGEEKWQTWWCCRDLAERACRMAQASAEKLWYTGSAEKERVTSVPPKEQLASMQELPLPKKKEQSRLSKVPDREGGENQGE